MRNSCCFFSQFKRIRWFITEPAFLSHFGLQKKSWIFLYFQLEAMVVEMQDATNGVKGSEQKLNVTTIPHVIAGETEAHKFMHADSNNIVPLMSLMFFHYFILMSELILKCCKMGILSASDVLLWTLCCRWQIRPAVFIYRATEVILPQTDFCYPFKSWLFCIA